MNINTILVVLEPDQTGWSLDNPLIVRAADLAKRHEASLLLLHVAYESSLGFGTFATRKEVEEGRLRILSDYGACQARLQQAIEQVHKLPVATETLWGPDASDSILRRAKARRADLIIKMSGKHSYFFGLLSNTDWDLLRGSEVPVWFVAPEGSRTPASGIIAAVDQSYQEEDVAEEFRLDEAAFDTAKTLSDRYASPLYAVHAFRLPRILPGFEGHVPSAGAAVAGSPSAVDPEADARARKDIAREHSRFVQDFVDQQGIPVDDLVLNEGPVDHVLSQVADAKEAGLIVMGSSSKTWWDHLLGRASAEPTLASAACDVLFVKAPASSAEQAAA